MNDVIIYTDGSARGNPNGPGGYGTVCLTQTLRDRFTPENIARGMSRPPITAWSLWLL